MSGLLGHLKYFTAREEQRHWVRNRLVLLVGMELIPVLNQNWFFGMYKLRAEPSTSPPNLAHTVMTPSYHLMAPCQFRWMKWVNGSRPVPAAHAGALQTHHQQKDCEAMREEPLTRVLFFTGPEHCDAIHHCFHCPICGFLFLELSAPKLSVLKPDANKTSNGSSSLIASLTFVHQIPEVGEEWEGRKPTGNKYPYEEITTSKCNSLLMFFLESSSVPSGCGPAANSCYRRTKTFK